jgi:hypothetical protein
MQHALGVPQMDDRTAIPLSEPTAGDSHSCTEPFLLCQLQKGKTDKLGHRVEDILWVGRDYAIYRSEKGVYVQFSDDPKEEAIQRSRFTEICPELCELRYFTSQIHSRWFGLRAPGDTPSLYDHNIAQAIMLVMQDRGEFGKKIAQQALKMAAQRVTNDNTILYVLACLITWLGVGLLGLVALTFSSGNFRMYVVAGLAGATGAVLSIAKRLQAFRLRPCDQSNMNYLMSGIRVGIGVVAGLTLLLLAPTILSDTVAKLVPHCCEPPTWQAAATLGLVAGFAERLMPNIMLWTSTQMAPSAGTPAQAVRNQEKL